MRLRRDVLNFIVFKSVSSNRNPIGVLGVNPPSIPLELIVFKNPVVRSPLRPLTG